jgi:hypothetical protein
VHSAHACVHGVDMACIFGRSYRWRLKCGTYHAYKWEGKVDDDWNAPKAARRKTTRDVVREELKILSWIKWMYSPNSQQETPGDLKMCNVLGPGEATLTFLSVCPTLC